VLLDVDSMTMPGDPEDGSSGSNEATTLQRVLRQVYGRTKGVSGTQSLADFLFKDRQSDLEEPLAENA